MRLADAALESAASGSDALGGTATGDVVPGSAGSGTSATAGHSTISGTSAGSGDTGAPDDGTALDGAALDGTALDGTALDGTALDGDAVFRIAVARFEAGQEAVLGERDDITFEDSPAPRRLAPYATAIAAVAHRGGGHSDDGEAGTGRLVLLYDPDGQPGWTGAFRLVAYVRADIEEEMAADPLLGEVGWSWLTDALELHAPGYSAPSGTVTRVITESFGSKSDELPATGFELRASWSPPQDADLSVNVVAWCDLLVAAAGLPVQPPGTKALRPGGPRPGQRRRR
jgi:hypothetical protein